MGADIISILFFITAIVLAFIRKINIGIVALALAVPCTMLIGLPGKEIIAGVNGNLFITLVGITLLFSIVNDTGALGLLAHKIVAVAGRRLWLIPILLFVAGGIITGAGPGGIPVLAIMIPMGIAVGIRVGYNPVMLSLIGICGMTGGNGHYFQCSGKYGNQQCQCRAGDYCQCDAVQCRSGRPAVHRL